MLSHSNQAAIAAGSAVTENDGWAVRDGGSETGYQIAGKNNAFYGIADVKSSV